MAAMTDIPMDKCPNCGHRNPAWQKLEAENARLRAALGEYLYETTHLAVPETLGGYEYRKTLIKYSAIKRARQALGDQP